MTLLAYTPEEFHAMLDRRDVLLRATVWGKPVPKGRPRFGNGRTYTPKRTVEHELLIRTTLFTKWCVEPHEGPVALSCVFYGADKTADWDNLGKIVSDALDGFVIANDRQIIEARMFIRPDDGNGRRTEIKLEAL